MKLTRLLTLITLLLILAACGADPATTEPTTGQPSDAAPVAQQPADIRGTITNVQSTPEGITITVAGQKEADTVYPEAIMRISGQTKITDAAGQALPDAQLTVGQRIEASYNGPVTRSLPPQGAAGTIRIIQ